MTLMHIQHSIVSVSVVVFYLSPPPPRWKFFEAVPFSFSFLLSHSQLCIMRHWCILNLMWVTGEVIRKEIIIITKRKEKMKHGKFSASSGLGNDFSTSVKMHRVGQEKSLRIPRSLVDSTEHFSGNFDIYVLEHQFSNFFHQDTCDWCLYMGHYDWFSWL